jgi:hypothetical protein
MPGIGIFSHLGVGKEVAWGTPIAATAYLPLISESIVNEIEQVMEPELRGIADEPPQYEGLHSVKGDVVVLCKPSTLGYLLRSCLGAPASGAGPPYTHVFTPTNTAFSATCELPPYTLEIDRDVASAFQYAGCVVDSLEISFSTTDKLLRATASILGKSVALIAPTAVSHEAADPFLWKEASFTLGGGAITTIESFSIRFSNNLVGVESLNATELISRIDRNGFRVFDINLTFPVLDTTEYTRFEAQGETTLEVDIVKDANNELKFETSKLRYVAYPLGTAGPERRTVAISAKGKYDSALGGGVIATLKNTTASY